MNEYNVPGHQRHRRFDLLFAAMAPETFGGDRIYKSFAQSIPYFGIIAMMLTMVIVAGDIDLSFPSVMALGMVGFVWTWDATNMVWLGIIAAIATGAAAGLFNGLVVTIIGLPSLVVTIGTNRALLNPLMWAPILRHHPGNRWRCHSRHRQRRAGVPLAIRGIGSRPRGVRRRPFRRRGTGRRIGPGGLASRRGRLAGGLQ